MMNRDLYSMGVGALQNLAVSWFGPTHGLEHLYATAQEMMATTPALYATPAHKDRLFRGMGFNIRTSRITLHFKPSDEAFVFITNVITKCGGINKTTGDSYYVALKIEDLDCHSIEELKLMHFGE